GGRGGPGARRRHRRRDGLARARSSSVGRGDSWRISPRGRGAGIQDGAIGVHIGLDIGGTKTEAVVTTPQGEVLAHHRVASGRGNDAVVAAALEAAERAAADAGITPAEAASVGVGVPGAVADGVVSHAVNLGIERLELAAALAGAWGVS